MRFMEFRCIKCGAPLRRDEEVISLGRLVAAMPTRLCPRCKRELQIAEFALLASKTQKAPPFWNVSHPHLNIISLRPSPLMRQ